MTGLLVDALECIDCGHATPGHYSGCLLRPALDPASFLPRRQKPKKAPKPFPCCGGVMACAEDCRDRCRTCGAAAYEKHDELAHEGADGSETGGAL